MVPRYPLEGAQPGAVTYEACLELGVIWRMSKLIYMCSKTHCIITVKKMVVMQHII